MRRSAQLEERLKPSLSLASIAGLGFTGSRRWLQMASVVSPKVLRLLMQRKRPRARDVRETFEQLGTTYIKLGQMIASAPSVFPSEYVKEFENCFDNTPPIAFSTVKRIVEKELGGSLDELYASFDETPLATASIAQVHAARLKSGADVVVKVQKPGVDQILSTDLNLIFFATRMTELLSPGLSKDALSGFVSEIYQFLLDECDFLKEAKNLEVFTQFLQEQNERDVVVPKPYHSLTTRKVLTMERLYGKSVSDFGNSGNLDEQAAERLLKAMTIWMASIRGCPFFHADLHSGNLMLLDDGRIGFIDFGMVGRIEEEVLRAAFSLFEGLSAMNAETVALAMLKMGMTRPDTTADSLSADIRQLFQRMDDHSSLNAATFEDSPNSDIDALILDLGRVARRHGIHFPYAFTLLIKQLFYFDRYMHELMPGVKLFDDEQIVHF